MRVLWVINSPLGKACEVLGKKMAQSGTWIDATAKEAVKAQIELAIATTILGDSMIKRIEEGIVYYFISGGKATRGRRAKRTNISKWKEVIEDFSPDIVQIWGSEFSDGIDVIESANGIPIVLYTQGVIRAISKYTLGNMPYAELISKVSLVHKITSIKYIVDDICLKRQAKYEQELAQRVDMIITDNEWCKRMYLCIAGKNIVKYHMLPMNTAFQNHRWDQRKVIPHTILCNAGRTPYKGMHMAFRALALVKDKYPDVIMHIPGDIGFGGIKKTKCPPYFEYLMKLSDELGIKENIHFTGVLSSEQMAHHMESSNVFIMPSCIENLSTTLREAMLVGVPSISSNVGCVSEYLFHGENGFLYRYEEYELLAQYICEVFEDWSLANSISSKATATIEDKYVVGNSGSILRDLYQQVLKAKNND